MVMSAQEFQTCEECSQSHRQQGKIYAWDRIWKRQDPLAAIGCARIVFGTDVWARLVCCVERGAASWALVRAVVSWTILFCDVIVAWITSDIRERVHSPANATATLHICGIDLQISGRVGEAEDACLCGPRQWS